MFKGTKKIKKKHHNLQPCDGLMACLIIIFVRMSLKGLRSAILNGCLASTSKVSSEDPIRDSSQSQEVELSHLS